MTFGKALPGLIFFVILTLLTSLAWAKEQKRILENNGTEVYNILPKEAFTLFEFFSQGIVYGRIRSNYFKHNWQDNSTTTPHDPKSYGIGGSLIYKSAPLKGVSGTVGLYTSQNLGLLDVEDARYGKAGKDAFSRHDVLKDGDWNMTVPAQAYLQYHFMNSYLRVGRQIFESLLAKSNDTKMIPNTFSGLSLTSSYFKNTTVKLAYFDKQKLRDHNSFHDVITYGNGGTALYDNWDNNDDSAVHKGLSYTNLVTSNKDVNNCLLIGGISNKSIENLKLDFWYNGVPDLFYSLTSEVNYTIRLTDGWILTPGFRYMEQFDDGAGRVGGAALTGKLAGMAGPGLGYKDADSVDGKLYAGRLVLKKCPVTLHFGYSHVADYADLISPWRGWPTQGYTRSMAQYNWEADTTSYMLKILYDFGKAGVINGFRTAIDCTGMDYDEAKERTGGITRTDRNIIHADWWYKLPFLPELEIKGRMGLVNANTSKAGKDPSYEEFRLEFNYLF